MPGLVDSIKPKAKSQTLLADSMAGIEQKVPDEMRDSYDSIVSAGSEILWGDKTNEVAAKYIDKVQKEKDIPVIVPQGIARLIGIVIKGSGQRPETLAPASMVASQMLMLHVLEYVQKKTKIMITERILAETSHATTKALFKLFGITKEKVKSVMTEIHQKSKNAPPEGEMGVDEELPPDENGDEGAMEQPPAEPAGEPAAAPVEGEVPPPEQSSVPPPAAAPPGV